MEPNIKVFRAHRALSWFYGLLLAFMAYMAYAMRSDPNVGFFYVYLVLFAVFFIAHHVTARGARDGKPWARISSTAIACLMLLGFPLGTIIGIYLLVNTWKPWDEQPIRTIG